MSDPAPPIKVCPTIKVRADGPYKVEGPVQVVDAEGEALVTVGAGETVALCRCGRTATAPYCDRSHRRDPHWSAEAR